MTPATKQFIWIMRIFTFIYVVGALVFFFMPADLFKLMNLAPSVFRGVEAIPEPVERFWVALSTSMMMMLAVTSLYSSLYPRTKGFVVIHLVSKAVSVAGFTYLFLREGRFFAYLLGAVTDSSVILVVLGFYLRSLVSGPRALGTTEPPLDNPPGPTT